ncbi:MAG: FAD-dependent pyridine nucleotide-disulfide oxidoreductase [Acidobacteria bacterium]|nr:FAD-dependent pyridine nucleotide-disulfide oxidoreductase [Acidobacteriota bacterium]
MKHVVIVGGGFAGLYATRHLRGVDDVEITLLDQHNYHLFQPLLYQVATAALNPSDIAVPIRAIVRKQRNVSVLLGAATAVDVEKKLVIMEDGQLAYDYLVLATGATHSYFGHAEWERDAPGLKTIDDALEIRRRVLVAFEAAERETDPIRQKAWLTFVVIGAGPTGVELAGALSEIARQTMLRDFRRINPSSARVILIEGKERVLPVYPPDLSESAMKQLRGLGVEVLVNAQVTNISDRAVTIGSDIIETHTVLWGAGVQASPLAKSLGVPLDRAGRVIVEPALTIPGHPEVFVLGDLAAVAQSDGSFVPGVAPAAIQEGMHTALNLERAVGGQPLRPFRYRDKGSLATIGRAAGVADFGKLHLSGFIAWFAWLAIHIFFLIGFRNRFLVMTQWAWAYVTYQRGARLITGGVRPLLKE